MAGERDEREDPREHLTELLALLLAGSRERVRTLTQGFLSGDLPITRWRDGMLSEMSATYAQATILGRQLAGSTRPPGPTDDLFGYAAALSQFGFLGRFTQDLLGDRYRDAAGGWQEAAVLQRAELYAMAALGVANRAWQETQEEQYLLWHTHPDERACEVCASRDGQRYPRAFCPTPGDGSSPCGGRCRCWVTTESGNTGFHL